MALVAQTVKVMHNTSYDHQGRAKISAGKPVIQKVVHAYIGGRIRTSSGDVWSVAKCPDKSADFITIIPDKKANK